MRGLHIHVLEKVDPFRRGLVLDFYIPYGNLSTEHSRSLSRKAKLLGADRLEGMVCRMVEGLAGRMAKDVACRMVEGLARRMVKGKHYRIGECVPVVCDSYFAVLDAATENWKDMGESSRYSVSSRHTGR